MKNQLKYDPFPLIFARGDAMAQLACLDLFGLGDSPRAKACQVELLKGQRSDGAFPSHLDLQQWGTLETVRSALLLLKVGMPPQGLNLDSAVRFLLKHQNPDGGWCENPALEIPPERVELSKDRSITWITADAVELLRQVGMEERDGCRAALAWLRAMQNRHGGWYSFTGSMGDQRGTTGDPDSSAQITFLMGEIFGDEDPVYLQGRSLFEHHLDACAWDAERGYRLRPRDGGREELDAYSLTHLLLSWVLDPPRRFASGYNVSDLRVRRIFEALAEIQRDDGGWRPFWTEESSPIYTVLAVKVLIQSGMMAQEELKSLVEGFVV